jgi:hypothetical protein
MWFFSNVWGDCRNLLAPMKSTSDEINKHQRWKSILLDRFAYATLGLWHLTSCIEFDFKNESLRNRISWFMSCPRTKEKACDRIIWEIRDVTIVHAQTLTEICLTFRARPSCILSLRIVAGTITSSRLKTSSAVHPSTCSFRSWTVFWRNVLGPCKHCSNWGTAAENWFVQ